MGYGRLIALGWWKGACAVPIMLMALLMRIAINAAYVRVYDRMRHFEAKAGPEEQEKTE